MKVTPNNIWVVPEYTIIECADKAKDSNSTFHTALEFASQYRDANLTPIFLYNSTEERLVVTSLENLNKKYC
jgi:hypothetical protein